jgi:Mitotic checkpoint regulator, MAD2B-interacting
VLSGMQGSKVSKGARKRGQLSSLLVEAYQNREALEEKIAEGRRNRKEAGNKYGAFCSIHVCGAYRLTFGKVFNNYPVMAMQVIV